ESHVGISCEGEVQIWNLTTGELHRLQPSSAHHVNLQALAFSGDGLFAATGGTDRSVRLYDLRTGNELRVYRGHEQGVTAVTFTADGRTLWSADQSGTLKQWDVTREQQNIVTQEGLGLHLTFGDLTFAADGAQVHTTRGSDPATVQTFDLATGIRR